MFFVEIFLMKKTCQTCPDLRQSLFWFSVPFLVLVGFLFLMASQNVFAETQVSIPIIAAETTCAESASLCGESTENTAPIKLVSNEEPNIDPPVVGIVSLNNFSGGDSPNTVN